MKRRETIVSLTEKPCCDAGCPPAGIAVGAQSAIARIVDDQQRHPRAYDESHTTQNDVGAAPTQMLDQE
jgi:hypothetical protein